jgi:hypothetical protein
MLYSLGNVVDRWGFDEEPVETIRISVNNSDITQVSASSLEGRPKVPKKVTWNLPENDDTESSDSDMGPDNTAQDFELRSQTPALMSSFASNQAVDDEFSDVLSFITNGDVVVINTSDGLATDMATGLSRSRGLNSSNIDEAAPTIKPPLKKILKASQKSSVNTSAPENLRPVNSEALAKSTTKAEALPKSAIKKASKVDFMAVPVSPRSCDEMMEAAELRKEELKSLLAAATLEPLHRHGLENELQIVRERLFALMELKIEMVDREADARNCDFYDNPTDSRKCELYLFACGNRLANLEKEVAECAQSSAASDEGQALLAELNKVRRRSEYLMERLVDMLTLEAESKSIADTNLDFMTVPRSVIECDRMMHMGGIKKEELKAQLEKPKLASKEKMKLETELAAVRKRLEELLSLKVDLVMEADDKREALKVSLKGQMQAKSAEQKRVQDLTASDKNNEDNTKIVEQVSNPVRPPAASAASASTTTASTTTASTTTASTTTASTTTATTGRANSASRIRVNTRLIVGAAGLDLEDGASILNQYKNAEGADFSAEAAAERKAWEEIEARALRDQEAAQALLTPAQVAPASAPTEPLALERLLDFPEALQFMTSRDLSALRLLIVKKSSSTFGRPKLGSPKLQDQRDQIFCLALMQLDYKIEEHERILQTIFRGFTGSTEVQPRFGSHWEAIGFQGRDPSTDLRGSGMLGLLQLLYLLKCEPAISRSIFALSRDKVQEFPLALISFNMTGIALQCLRDGLIYPQVHVIDTCACSCTKSQLSWLQ